MPAQKARRSVRLVRATVGAAFTIAVTALVFGSMLAGRESSSLTIRNMSSTPIPNNRKGATFTIGAKGMPRSAPVPNAAKDAKATLKTPMNAKRACLPASSLKFSDSLTHANVHMIVNVREINVKSWSVDSMESSSRPLSDCQAMVRSVSLSILALRLFIFSSNDSSHSRVFFSNGSFLSDTTGAERRRTNWVINAFAPSSFCISASSPATGLFCPPNTIG
mmetsp:Transcript_21612/g.42984  ORF Transcript_21612/g.42984 Transcript_21612/m.42984 type:complete len:221 (-) Transcript_21612:832-1494(-)